MLKKFKSAFFKNIKILGLFFLVFFTVTVALYVSHQKSLVSTKYINLFENIYLKKTLREIIHNLEPRFKKYNHKIKPGETFDKILKEYLIDKQEIKDIKESLLKKVNINKLNTNQKIQIVIDQTNNKIKEFTFQISNTEKIYLKRNIEDDIFNQEIIILKLN